MTRLPVPPDVVAEIMFASMRTCCVCRVAGRSVQIHHIDGDHANNEPENLCALCLDCHHLTQVEGGFARKLDAAQVRRHLADWTERVLRRRDEADRLSTESMVTALPNSVAGSQGPAREQLPSIDAPSASISLDQYVASLPDLRRRAYDAARIRLETGVTSEMVEAYYSINDVLQNALSGLASYYPVGHFDRENLREYVADAVTSRYAWHRYRHEPHGRGQDGTIVRVLVAQSAIEEIERMVVEMVRSLTESWETSPDPQFEAWKERWVAASEPPAPAVEFSVSDGKSVVLTATTRGDAFVLVVRGQIVKASKDIDHSHPYEFRPRRVSAGEDIENYTVATINGSDVAVYGEDLEQIQCWIRPAGGPLSFAVDFDFVNRTTKKKATIARCRVHVSLDTRAQRLSARVIRRRLRRQLRARTS